MRCRICTYAAQIIIIIIDFWSRDWIYCTLSSPLPPSYSFHSRASLPESLFDFVYSLYRPISFILTANSFSVFFYSSPLYLCLTAAQFNKMVSCPNKVFMRCTHIHNCAGFRRHFGSTIPDNKFRPFSLSLSLSFSCYLNYLVATILLDPWSGFIPYARFIFIFTYTFIFIIIIFLLISFNAIELSWLLQSDMIHMYVSYIWI